MFKVIDEITREQFGIDCLSLEEAKCLRNEHDSSVIIDLDTNEIVGKYRVVSDRRSYGLYNTYKEALQRESDLIFEASCNYSEEQFWIEEE